MVVKFNRCDKLMKKRCYYLIISLCLCWGTMQAGGPFGKQLVLPWGVTKNLSGLSGVSSAALSNQVRRSALSSLQLSGYNGLITPQNAAHVLQTQQKLEKLRSQLQLPEVPTFSPAASLSAPAVQPVTPAATPGLAHPYLSGTFQARDMSALVPSHYSGTLFEVDGQIFGAVAGHIFGSGDEEITKINRSFIADIYHDGNFVSVPARAVVISPLFDVALVIFNPKDQALLGQPFQLARSGPELGQTLSSHGFVGQRQAVDINDRRVVAKTPLSFRTTMPIAQSLRRGLCGSAIVNKQGLLAGMHTGSTRKTNEQEDVAYAVPAEILYQLAQGYTLQDNRMFELNFDGHKFSIYPDEYLTKLTLLDAQNNVLWSGKSSSYFSYSLLRNKIAQLSPRYVEFVVGRVGWSSPYSSYLNYEPAVRKVRYEISDTTTQEP